MKKIPFITWASALIILSACAAPPTAAPTAKPNATAAPVATSTIAPTAAPTATPVPATANPTAVPTSRPTLAPTLAPTSVPTATPTLVPTLAPAATATAVDHGTHTVISTTAPTVKPTNAPAPPPANTGATKQVDIRLFQFQPNVIEVKVGTTVTWTNRDFIEHSVTQGKDGKAGGGFDSGFFTQGKSFSFTFTQPGEYAYFCARHNSMTGMVKVVP